MAPFHRWDGQVHNLLTWSLIGILFTKNNYNQFNAWLCYLKKILDGSTRACWLLASDVPWQMFTHRNWFTCIQWILNWCAALSANVCGSIPVCSYLLNGCQEKHPPIKNSPERGLRSSPDLDPDLGWPWKSYRRECLIDIIPTFIKIRRSRFFGKLWNHMTR